MNNTIKCPVCGNPGVPDYHNEDVVCPHCNSNLGIYRILHSVAEGNNSSSNKTKRYNMLSVVLPILAVLLMVIFAFVYSNRYNQMLAYKDSLATELKDSIKKLNVIVQAKQSPLPEAEQCIDYKILPNDSPWGIVHKFYGRQSDWENISRKLAEANNLWDEKTSAWKPIHPGQSIKIYNFK